MYTIEPNDIFLQTVKKFRAKYNWAVNLQQEQKIRKVSM